MSTRVFLSTVSDEFRDYRDQLRRDLTRHNVEVKVQEDFKDLGSATLDKLDVYIAACDAVVHLVGDMTGAAAKVESTKAIVKKYTDLMDKLPPLQQILESRLDISYTQWEAWLALYHDKLLLIAKADDTAPRGPRFAPTDASRAAQRMHLERLSAFERYPGCTFTGPDNLAKQILSGAILDLLVVAALESRGVLQTSEHAGLQRRIVISLAHRLKPDVLDFEQAITELERAVQVAVDVIARGERGTNDDAFVNAVLARVADKVRNDDLDGGAGAIDEALAELEAKHRRSQVVLLEEGVKVDTLRRDAVAVARRIEMIVAADHPTDRPAWLPEFQARYDEFEADGDAKGINFSLAVAIELARRKHATARDTNERGDALDLLGNALWRLGERESGTAQLEEAVAAFRAALTERTRERVPLDWARTQGNLGGALVRLGERGRGTTRLEEAVDAFREALKELTRERVPVDWATAQNNLGNALATLGQRESGTTRLKEAVDAFREALKERTRERVPLSWAITQSNLGNALAKLGERERSTTLLEEAVDAFREALKERTRERVPLDWARSTGNQGHALMVLAARIGDARMAQTAVSQIDLALATARDADHAPLAAEYEALLPAARALVRLLSKR